MSKNAGAYTVMHNAQSAVIRARQFTSKAKSEDERSYNQAPADGSVHQTWLAYIGTCTFIRCSLRTEKSVSVHYAWMIALAAGGSQSSGAQFMNSFGDFFWNGGTTGNKEHEVYVDGETLRRLRRLVEKDDAVEHVSGLLTMHFGPHEVLLTLEVKFRDELSMVGVRNAIGRIHKSVQEDYPDITRIYFASESIAQEERRSDSSAAD